MTSPTFPELPAGLRARLDAAGVTDAATLAAALDADPALRREYQAFLLDALPAIPDEEQLRALWQMIPSKDEDAFLAAAEARAAAAETSGDAGLAAALRERIDALRSFQQDIARDGEILRQALERLEAAATDDDLAAVWRDVPLELEETFLNLVALQAEEYEQHGDAERAAHVRACHERLSAIQQQQRAGAETMRRLLEQLAADVEALAAAADHQGVVDVWNRIPLELEESFLQLTEHLAGELEQTDAATAARLRELIALLRQLREAHQALQEAPPAARALLAFLQAASDADATRVFDEYKEILQPFEAQRELDDLAQQAPDEQRAAIAARAALLRRLRGGDPAPRPTPAAVTPAETRRGTPGSIVYINSAVVEGGSGTAIVYNNIVMERRWNRPCPERLSIDTIERTRDLEQVARIITERGQLAITGGTRTATAAVQGMPGIGKTILARQLALALNDRYPGGVIWEEIGPEIRAPEDTQPILNRWARYALTVPPHLDNQLAFDAGAVRALFAAQGQPLLVILDNVWSLEGIRWLRAALPDNAHLVITTRLETVMIGLGGGEYVLGLLTPDEARALIALRLNWTELPADHYDWADALAAGVGYHTLALDVAIRRLRLDARSPGTPRWREQVNRLLDHIRSGQGFERLALPDSERNQNVEAVLAYSYDRMDDTARARFRMLGAFAPEATFGSAAVAALWQCDVEQADEMLSAFAGAALLEAGGGDGRWRQHSLLRGYALALLRREGEHEAAAARHAAFYAAAMRTADDAQRFYEVLGDYAQLRHAFAWAIENDLELALDLVANTANLQKAHGYGRDNLAWAEQALAAAQQRGTPAQIARARVSLGNALQHAAGLPGEDRGARLREALAAYDAALRIYTAETVPLDYAATQNNRAVLLRDLASVPGEDRGARLREALAAYDAALRYRTPETVPLDYAATQNNRANLLSDLASVPGEDRGARLREALAAYDAALRYRTPETVPLAYAATQNNRAVLLSDLASVPGEDRGARLREALAACDAALRIYTAETVPLDYAATQNNRANLLSDLASVPGEDRGARLRQALSAYDEALRFYTPTSAPLAYATTQNNRGNVLQDLATLAEEDRAARLRQALSAYDEALRFYTPTSAPLAYATTQNNRGNVLQDLATLAEEDRAARLRQALSAYDEALRFYTPTSAPLAYATTQNNRGNVLQDLATLAEEDRAARLRQALSAYDEALRFYTPTSAPLDYAMTQGNLLNLYQTLAGEPGEDRMSRLLDALRAGWTAFRFFTALQHSDFQQRVMHLLRGLRAACGDDFDTLWAALDVGPPPEWLIAPEEGEALSLLSQLIQRLLAVSSGEELLTFWRELPAELEEPLAAAAEEAARQSGQAGDAARAQALRERAAGLRAIRAAADAAQSIQQALQRYIELVKAAEASGNDIAAWRAAVEAGEALLAPEFADTLGVGDAVRAHVASTWNALGNALHDAGDGEAAVAAYDRAIALQPDQAMWRRNRVATLIDLGRRAEAAEELARARALEPDAARLAELEARLRDEG
jgi:tetratricopeptide (TPR) repeat protein